MIIYFLIILILIINYCKYNFNGGNINFDKLLNNIINLKSIGCTKNHINDTKYYNILKTKDENDLYNICKDAYDSKLKYDDDINQQLCCEKNTVCLPKCKKTINNLNKTELDDFIVFLNNTNNNKRFSDVKILKKMLNLLENKLNTKYDNMLIKINNYIDVYSKINTLYNNSVLDIQNLKYYVNDVLRLLINIKETLEITSIKKLSKVLHDSNDNDNAIFKRGFSTDIPINQYIVPLNDFITDFGSGSYTFQSRKLYDDEIKSLYQKINILEQNSSKEEELIKIDLINSYHDIRIRTIYLIFDNYPYFLNFLIELDKTLDNFLFSKQNGIVLTNFNNYKKLLEKTKLIVDNLYVRLSTDRVNNFDKISLILNEYRDVKYCSEKTSLMHAFKPHIDVGFKILLNIKNTLDETSTKKIYNIFKTSNGTNLFTQTLNLNIPIFNYFNPLNNFLNNYTQNVNIRNNSNTDSIQTTCAPSNYQSTNCQFKKSWSKIFLEFQAINTKLDSLQTNNNLQTSISKYYNIQNRIFNLLYSEKNYFNIFTTKLEESLNNFLIDVPSGYSLLNFKDYKTLYDTVKTEINSSNIEYDVSGYTAFHANISPKINNIMNNLNTFKNHLYNYCTNTSYTLTDFHNTRNFNHSTFTNNQTYKNYYNKLKAIKDNLDSNFSKSSKHANLFEYLKVSSKKIIISTNLTNSINSIGSTPSVGGSIYKNNLNTFISNYNSFRDYLDHFSSFPEIKDFKKKIEDLSSTSSSNTFRWSDYSKKRNIEKIIFHSIIGNLLDSFNFNHSSVGFNSNITNVNYTIFNQTYITSYKPLNRFSDYRPYVSYLKHITELACYRIHYFPNYATSTMTFATTSGPDSYNFDPKKPEDYAKLLKEQIEMYDSTHITRGYTIGNSKSSHIRNETARPKLGYGVFHPDYDERREYISKLLGRSKNFQVEYFRRTYGVNDDNLTTNQTEYYLWDHSPMGPPNSYLHFDCKPGTTVGTRSSEAHCYSTTSAYGSDMHIITPSIIDMLGKFSYLEPFPIKYTIPSGKKDEVNRGQQIEPKLDNTAYNSRERPTYTTSDRTFKNRLIDNKNKLQQYENVVKLLYSFIRLYDTSLTEAQMGALIRECINSPNSVYDHFDDNKRICGNNPDGTCGSDSAGRVISRWHSDSSSWIYGCMKRQGTESTARTWNGNIAFAWAKDSRGKRKYNMLVRRGETTRDSREDPPGGFGDGWWYNEVQRILIPRNCAAQTMSGRWGSTLHDYEHTHQYGYGNYIIYNNPESVDKGGWSRWVENYDNSGGRLGITLNDMQVHYMYADDNYFYNSDELGAPWESGESKIRAIRVRNVCKYDFDGTYRISGATYTTKNKVMVGLYTILKISAIKDIYKNYGDLIKNKLGNSSGPAQVWSFDDRFKVTYVSNTSFNKY